MVKKDVGLILDIILGRDLRPDRWRTWAERGRFDTLASNLYTNRSKMRAIFCAVILYLANVSKQVFLGFKSLNDGICYKN